MVENLLSQLREGLWCLYEEAPSWDACADGSGFHGEYLRQIANGEKEPPERTTLSLLRWMQEQPQLANVQPPTPEERERLAQLLERVASFVRRGYLPEAAWSDGDDDPPSLDISPATEGGDSTESDAG